MSEQTGNQVLVMAIAGALRIADEQQNTLVAALLDQALHAAQIVKTAD